MLLLERLRRQGFSWAKVWRASAFRPQWSLLHLGLPPKTIDSISYGGTPSAHKGTKHQRRVADLRNHHLTQRNFAWKYNSGDLSSGVREASKELCYKRADLISNPWNKKPVPLPGWTACKQDITIWRKKTKKFKASPLSSEVDINDIKEKRKRKGVFSSDVEHDQKRRKLEPRMGEDPSNSEQTQPSDNQDLKMVIAKSMWPTVSLRDIAVAKAAASLMSMHQGSSSVIKPASTDRETLKEACSNSGKVQPPAQTEEPPSFVAISRTASFSHRCLINRSLVEDHGYKSRYRRNQTLTRPSKKFRSFFVTRRLRKLLLMVDESLWDEEDVSFMQSGQNIAEPDAGLGAEFIAKVLLDGHRSPLRKLLSHLPTAPRLSPPALRTSVSSPGTATICHSKRAPPQP